MGENTSKVMTWYIKKVRIRVYGQIKLTKIKKGEPVKEDAPAKFPLYVNKLVAEGPPNRLYIEVMVCEDLENKGAPVYRDSSTLSQYPSVAEGSLTSCRCKEACGAYGRPLYDTRGESPS